MTIQIDPLIKVEMTVKPGAFEYESLLGTHWMASSQHRSYFLLSSLKSKHIKKKNQTWELFGPEQVFPTPPHPNPSRELGYCNTFSWTGLHIMPQVPHRDHPPFITLRCKFKNPTYRFLKQRENVENALKKVTLMTTTVTLEKIIVKC